MIILFMVAVALLYASFARFMGRDSGIRGSHSAGTPLRLRPADAGIFVGDVPAADHDPERATWTALDDLQLNRLLKESS